MSERKAYLVGGGIASLASAAYLIRDGRFLGKDIIIIEAEEKTGGSLVGYGDSDKGYVMGGGRKINFSYSCTYELLSFIPSTVAQNKTVLDEIIEFNQRHKSEFSFRILQDGRAVSLTTMGFTYKDRFDLLELMMKSEDSLDQNQIQDCFEKEFFETKFWHMWASMFLLQPWHSAIEFRRYLHRFIHEFSLANTLNGIDHTPYNQNESIIQPLLGWLRKEGVHCLTNSEVTDLEFQDIGSSRSVSKIMYRRNENINYITVNAKDLVFVTNGSMSASSSLGSMRTAPLLKSKTGGGDWALWEKIAFNHPELGRPSAFSNRVEDSKGITFTVTLQDPLLLNLLEKHIGQAAGTTGLVCLADSNWLLSLMLTDQPLFLNQPENTMVFWGVGLAVDQVGNFIDKKMSDCTGEEILIELISHLRFTEDQVEILNSAICIPCMLPFLTSQFLTRKKSDRAPVIPEKYSNLAMIGQYCELPEEVTGTIEYSVRSAQTAVYELLHIEKEIPQVFDSSRDFQNLFDSLKMIFREPFKPKEEEHPGL